VLCQVGLGAGAGKPRLPQRGADLAVEVDGFVRH
jgi:hypothetical protein